MLGIFLGAFGGHNWYLGENGKGIAHVCMMSGGVILEIIVGAVLPNVLSWSMLYQLAWLISILTPIALLAMSASGVWGLIEGIIILSQGDAGLVRKGYAVAQPMPMPYGPQSGYGPQGNYGPQNGYGPQGNFGPQQNNFGPMDNGFSNGMNQSQNSQNNNGGNENGQQ